VTAEPPLEFSWRLPVGSLGREPRRVRLAADSAAREALARRFDLLALDSLVGEVTVTRAPDGPTVHVQGRMSADVVQACVVTLEPVAAHIEAPVDARFAPAEVLSAAGNAACEVAFSIEDEDPPEPFVDDSIELGELLAQLLGMALDPYPRAPGVTAPAWRDPELPVDDDAPPHPFATLVALKKNGD